MASPAEDKATDRTPLEQIATCLADARLHRFGDLDLARRDAQHGLDLLRALQTPQDRYEEAEAELLVILANADRAAGQIEPAVIQCHAALKLLSGRPISRVNCEVWISLGWAYAQIGEFASALRYTMRGLKSSRDVGEREQEAHALDVLGTVYAIFGDSIEALRYLDEAARIAKALGHSKRLCSVLNNLAMTQLGREELAPALESALESLRIARQDALKVPEPNIVDTVASVLAAMGRFTDAEGYLAPPLQKPASARRPRHWPTCSTTSASSG
jgi:tetratricopeptide (TPR) repeat protein